MQSILRFAVSIWYHLFAVNNIFINIFSSKLILCKFSCSFLDLPDEKKPSGRVVNPLASLFTCKILLFFCSSWWKHMGWARRIWNSFASQTKSIFWQSWKGKKSLRCFVLLFHVHSLYFFFSLAFRVWRLFSSSPEPLNDRHRTFNKKRNRFIVNTRTHERRFSSATSRKEFDDHWKDQISSCSVPPSTHTIAWWNF